MSLFLKQSTSVVISFGSFLDKTDGVTEETGLVSALDHATTGIKLSKNGGALTIRHATVTATTYDAYGMYRVTLDTTDTNTLGTLRMAFNEAATCLPVWQDFMVLPANVYDSLVGGTDALDVSAIQFAGQTITASGGVTIPAATLASTTNITAAAGCAVSSIGANVITAASIQADAITDAKVASDVTIASVTGAVGSVTGAVGSVTGAVGSVTGNVGGNVVGSVGSVVGHTAQTGDSFARLGAPAGASVSADIAAVKSDTGSTYSNLSGNGYFDDNIGAIIASSAPTAGQNASQVRTELTTELGRIDVATSTRLATAGYTAPLDAAGTRTAVGLATANLDTQLGAIDDYLDTEVAAIKAKTDNLPASPADEATLTAMKGATFAGATDSLEAIRDRGDAAWATATGFSTLDAAGVRTAVGLASANLDTQLTAIDDYLDTEVAAIKAKTDLIPAAPASTTNITQATGIDITKILGTAISTPATAGILDVNIVNIGGSAADLGATPGMLDVRLAEVSLGGGTQLRANLGLATADLDTQLAAIDDYLDTEVAAIKAKTDNLPAAPAAVGDIPSAAAVASQVRTELTTELGRIDVATSTRLATAGYTAPLDAAGTRTAVGLATANLDTQLTAIDDLLDTEVAAIYNRIGAPVGVSIAADIAGITATVDAADIRAAIGMASANLDTQLGNTYNRIGAPVFGNISGDIAANYAILTNIEDSVGVGVSADVAAIKAKTDNLPADPASSTNVTAVYSRVGAPAGASVSADIAAVKAETATINTATGAAAIRTAVGLAAANLDTQLAAIDDLLDTEIGAIKAKTDLIPASPAAVGSAMTLADEAITDAKIAELAFQGKHFDTDVEISAVTGAVGSVTAGVTVTTNNDKTGYTLTSGERNTLADAIFDRADGAVSGKTLREALSVILGVLSGKVSGAGTTTITFRHINDTKDVIVATVDAAGNRTAVTVTP